MSWFSDLPVQRKLGFAMLITSTVALVVACGVFLAVEYMGYRRSIIHNVATLAQISADNSTAAIAFVDKSGARQNLEALRAEPQIVAATLYDANDQIFARYTSRLDEMLPGNPAAPPGVRLENGYVIAVQPVVEGSRRLGTLYVQATMEQIYERMRTYGLIVLGVLAASFALAGLIASMLGRTLARPMLELANTAGAISVNQDYSLRARQYGTDELGQLTATFNAMLAKTQSAVDGLRESEWAHRELVRALPTAAYMGDAHGLITIYNSAAVALWGRTPEIGHEYWCGSHRMYRPDGTPLPVGQSPMAVALKEGRPVRGEEIIIERPDGTRRNVLSHPEPIRDTAGKLVGIVNMLVDITEQKRADAAVRQLAAIVESSDDAIIGKDLNGVITTWNRGAELLFGYTAAQIIGESILILIPPEHRDEEPGILEKIRRGEPIQHYETVRRRRNGTLVNVALTVSPIRDKAGRIIGASKISRDITERKRADHQFNFVSQLSQQLGALTDPQEIIRAASRAVGVYLNADRCFFLVDINDEAKVLVQEDWGRVAFTSINGVHEIADFGSPDLWRAMIERPLAIDDKTTHPLTRDLGPASDLFRIGAHATVPFLREGRWIASLIVTSEIPRVWRKDEMALLENVLTRVWPVVERARSQGELRESERRQRELMRALPVACFTLDAKGQLAFFNDAAVQLWGRVPELGKTLSADAVLTTTLDGVTLRTDETPVMIAFREKRPVRGIEVLVVRPDGTKRWVVPHPDPIFDAQGNCTGVIDVVMDVTEERTAHEKIQKSAERLNLAIASANLGDWNWDAASDLIRLSPRTCEIYGVTSDANFTRTKMRELLHPDDQERARLALQQAIDTHTDYDVEYRVNPPGLNQRWVAAKGRSIYANDGRVMSMVGVVQDITERKQAEIELQRARDEALDASRAKDDFLAALSHELRTPLNPVLLIASDAANNASLAPKVRADFDLILKNVNLEARLIDDLLDLTRITRGKLHLQQNRCTVHSVLQDALANVEAEIAEKNLRLEIDFGAARSRVRGDSVRLQQVFWNILKNAVKFTPEGGSIAVNTALANEGKSVRLKISDTGIGMTQEEIGRVFEAFSQGDHAATSAGVHRFGGLGLGLAITKMLVDLHGGDIQAFSEGRDRGSLFQVDLPLYQETAEDKKNPIRPDSTVITHRAHPSSTAETYPSPARRILLVEDHVPTRQTLHHLLRQRQFEVSAVGSAAAAERLAQTQEFDLLISDVGLPDRDGYSLMAALRISRPELPGIALSGYGMEEDLARSRAAGFAIHLVKPVTIGMLEDAIASMPVTFPTPRNANPLPS